MNTIFGNFLERTIPSLKGALISLNMGNSTSEMNLENFKALMAPEPTPAPYKVYTALVTQSGGTDPQGIDTGSLTIGVTYKINNDSTGMDFTNVGAPNNELETYFVATGTTPASWGSGEGTGNSTLTYDTGAPTVTVLENTIGNIWFIYVEEGGYDISSIGLFTSNKSVSPNDQTACLGVSGDLKYYIYLSQQDENAMQIITSDEGIAGIDGALNSKLIEIRVYN